MMSVIHEDHFVSVVLVLNDILTPYRYNLNLLEAMKIYTF